MRNYSPEEEEAFFDQIDQVYAMLESDMPDKAEEMLLQIEASVPDPKDNCSVGAILLDSIYAFYEQSGQLQKALPFFLKETAFLKSKIGNERIQHVEHFISTGSIYYHLSELDQAREYFKLAYKISQKGAFADFHPDFLFIALASDEDFADFKSNFVPHDEDDPLEELTDEQQDMLDEYCENGDHEMNSENYGSAASWYQQALDILPEPKDEWEAYGYIAGSLGDALFWAGKYNEAKESLLTANNFYSLQTVNPFILLRLGSTLKELGEDVDAVKFLHAAYNMEGAQIFEEDQKYLQFLKKHIKL